MFSQPYKCTLSPEMLKKAKEELNEDPNTRHLEIKTLRERLEQLPGYRGRTDDSFLLRFLRCGKFDQERAFKRIKNFYTLRKEHPEMFDNLTPKRARRVLESGMVGVLKHRAPDGSRILFYRAGSYDPALHGSLSDLTANDYLMLSKLVEEEETQVCGVTAVVDLKGLGWNHVKSYSPSNAKLETALFQDAFPIRFKAFHHLNEPTFFDVIMAIAKPFMKEKMLKRIHMHGDKLEKLHEFLPPDILPEELGGTQPPFSTEEWAAKMLASEEEFVEDNKYGFVDMTIRGKEDSKADATQTLAGTFRKLNVD